MALRVSPKDTISPRWKANEIFHWFRPNEIELYFVCGKCGTTTKVIFNKNILPHINGNCLKFACESCRESNAVNICIIKE